MSVGAGLGLGGVVSGGGCCLCSGLASLQDLQMGTWIWESSLGDLLWVAADLLVCLSSGPFQSTGLGLRIIIFGKHAFAGEKEASRWKLKQASLLAGIGA